MSHITNQSQRDENAAIRACPHASVKMLVNVYDDFHDVTTQEWQEQNQCGETKYLSAAQDQCIRCGKIFTY